MGSRRVRMSWTRGSTCAPGSPRCPPSRRTGAVRPRRVSRPVSLLRSRPGPHTSPRQPLPGPVRQDVVPCVASQHSGEGPEGLRVVVGTGGVVPGAVPELPPWGPLVTPARPRGVIGQMDHSVNLGGVPAGWPVGTRGPDPATPVRGPATAVPDGVGSSTIHGDLGPIVARVVAEAAHRRVAGRLRNEGLDGQVRVRLLRG